MITQTTRLDDECVLMLTVRINQHKQAERFAENSYFLMNFTIAVRNDNYSHFRRKFEQTSHSELLNKNTNIPQKWKGEKGKQKERRREKNCNRIKTNQNTKININGK